MFSGSQSCSNPSIQKVYTKKVSNGRIDIEGPPPDVRFSMWDKIPVNQITTFRDALTGNWENTDLSNAFFSKENIQIIQIV